MERRDVRLHASAATETISSRDYRDDAWGMPEVRGRRRRLRLGQRHAARHPAAPNRSSTRSHVKGFSKLCPHVPEEIRGTYAAHRQRLRHRVFQEARHHRGRAAARAPVRRTTRSWSTKGSRTTGATTRSATSRPDASYCQQRHRRRAGHRVQADGEEPPRRRHRGHPRRGLQPHRRGQPPRPDALLPRHRQLQLLPPRRRRTRATTWITPAPATRSTCMHPRVLQLIMDSACATGCTEMHVDGFRFDLAATLARELHDVSKLSRLLRHHPPGPGPLPGQAHRRAVGRRRRRLPGRQLPRPLGRVERQVPRRRARLLEGRRRPRRRVRLPPHRQPRSLPVRTASAPTPASTSSPRTTASPCTISSATTTSTTRPTARTTRTATTTTTPGTAAPRARPTTRRSTRCAAASSAISSPRCSSPRACRCSAAATSAAAPSRATTTPTARTTRSAGLHWDRDEARSEQLSRVHRAADPASGTSTPSSAGRSFSRAARFAARRSRTSCGSTPAARR